MLIENFYQYPARRRETPTAMQCLEVSLETMYKNETNDLQMLETMYKNETKDLQMLWRIGVKATYSIAHYRIYYETKRNVTLLDLPIDSVCFVNNANAA